MKRFQYALLAITVALAFSACTFNPPAATVAAGPTGTVTFRITPVSPAVFTAFKAPAGARDAGFRAFLGMDSISFDLSLGGVTVDQWTTTNPSGVMYQAGGITVAQNRSVPVGDGYVLTVKIFNNDSSTTVPMAMGVSSSFTVTQNVNTPVQIVCVPPYNPENPSEFLTVNLAENTTTEAMQLAVPWIGDQYGITSIGTEKWFRAVPNGNKTAFTATPVAASGSQAFVIVCVFDASGTILGSANPQSGNGTPTVMSAFTVPGNTYYIGVMDFGGAAGNRSFTFKYAPFQWVEESLGAFNVWHPNNLAAYTPKLIGFDVTAGNIYKVKWDDSYSGSQTYNLDIKVTGYLADKTAVWLGPQVDSGYDPGYTYTAASTGRLYLNVESFYSGGSGTFALRVDEQVPGANNPPGAFNLYNPVSGENRQLPVSLMWYTSTDPDPGDTVTYEVYCDTYWPPTTLVGATTATSLAVQSLTAGSNIYYYWRVKASDGKGGETWSGTDHANFYKLNTMPNVPTLLSPINYDTVTRTPTFSWSCTDPDGDVLTYELVVGGETKATGVTGTSFTITDPPLNGGSYYIWSVIARDPYSVANSSGNGNFYTNYSLSHNLYNFTFQQAGWSNWSGTYSDSGTWYAYANNSSGGDYVPNWTFDLDPYYLWNGPIDIQMRTSEPGALDSNVVYMADLNNNPNGYGMCMYQYLATWLQPTSNTKLKLRFKIISFAGGSFQYPWYEAPLKVSVMLYGNWHVLTGFTISPYSSDSYGEVVGAGSWIERDINLLNRYTTDGYYLNGMDIQAIRVECNGWAWQVLVDTVDLHE